MIQMRHCTYEEKASNFEDPTEEYFIGKIVFCFDDINEIELKNEVDGSAEFKYLNLDFKVD